MGHDRPCDTSPPLLDSWWFRRVWASGLSTSEIGAVVALSGATVGRRAKHYGYPRRCWETGALLGRMPLHSPAFPDWVPEKIKEQAPRLGRLGRAVLAATDSGAARDAAHGSRWPLGLDTAIATSGGKYAALAEISKTFDRPVAALMQRWHKMRAG